MNIEKKTENGICQIFLEGRFDANTANLVEQAFKEQIQGGERHFILDLENVPFIASAGLRVILVIAKQLRSQQNGDLRISNLQPNVKKVFEISGLNNVLKIFDDHAAAMASYSQ